MFRPIGKKSVRQLYDSDWELGVPSESGQNSQITRPLFQIYNVGNTYTLSIPRAHRYHSGQYTISAANSAGACTGHIRLNVLSKSDIKLPIRYAFAF